MKQVKQMDQMIGATNSAPQDESFNQLSGAHTQGETYPFHPCSRSTPDTSGAR